MFIEPRGDLKHVTFPDTIRIRIYNRYSTVVSRVTNYKLPRPRVFITRNALTAVLYLLHIICKEKDNLYNLIRSFALREPALWLHYHGYHNGYD